MSLLTRALSRMIKLPKARVRRVAIERGLRITMPDGIDLLADCYTPAQSGPHPTLLIRTPYGRGAPFTWFAELFAERGYAVVLQSCRGTFGSGGVYDPFHHEATDGAATLDWLSAQPDTGPIAMFGPSYLGYTQWAVAGHPALRAHAMQVTSAQFRTPIQTGGSFSFETMLTWCYIVHHQELPWHRVLRSYLLLDRTLARPFLHLPLARADELALGRAVPYFRAWLEHDSRSEFWSKIDHRRRIVDTVAPVHMISGWYDVFLPELLHDYATLRRAGRKPHLVIGPWTHNSPGAVVTALRESVSWFDAHLQGRGEVGDKAVRVQLMGTSDWLSFDAWPPPATPTRFYLQPHGRLGPNPPADSSPDSFHYDPCNPTPSVGGTILSFTRAGAKNQSKLEARPDVLVYSTERLESDVDVAGPVTVELFVSTSIEHADVFAKLCDVDTRGRSINVCDGLQRLRPGDPPAAADGLRKVIIELFPTAQRFRRGHRIRLQISGGAHPRFARNLGTGENASVGAAYRTCEHRLFHDERHPSALVLPILVRSS